MSYDETNRGQIWRNDKKKDPADSLPDFTGSLDVEGKRYWVSAWKRAANANPNAPALKFSIQRKDETPNQAPQRDDDIPF